MGKQKKNPAKPVAPKNTAEPKNDLTSGQVPVVPHVPPSPRDAAKTAPAPQDNTPPWKKRLEVAAAIIAAGLLVVNIFQMLATQKAADAAKNAADIASTALHVSERAYLSITDPVLDISNKTVAVGIRNTGRLTSKSGELKVYNLVANVDPNGMIHSIAECHRRRTVNMGIVPGLDATITLVFRKMSEADIRSSSQKLIAFATFTYNDGFDASQPETIGFCAESVYYPALGKVLMSDGCPVGYYLSRPELTAHCEDDGITNPNAVKP